MSARLSLRDRVALRVARGLEEGTWNGSVANALSRAWGELAARALARPLVWSDRVRVLAVGGATLGGSGKTPLAIACARALAETGASVALVAHGYRAKPGGARVVHAGDRLFEVGDEAIVAARALAGIACVVVARSRQAAVDLAAERADVVVLDGVLQTAPARASLSLLALDAESPWGAGEVVPRGDLRAARGALLDACDGAVILRDEEEGGERSLVLQARWGARVRSRGAFVSGALVPWGALAPLRLGLFVALARPARVLALLARRGVMPRRVVRLPDHGVSAPAQLSLLRSDPSVDLWLATPKCALQLEAAGLPHAVLDHALELDAELLASLRALPRALRELRKL